MPNPELIPEPFAQSGDKNTIPLERAIADPIYRASWKAGFPPDTRLPKDLGGEAPDGLDFNGVLNILSQAVVFLQKGNAYQFDAALAPYPIGALVRSNDNLTTYQSTVPNNSNNPNSNMTGWRVYNSSTFVVDNLTTNDGTKALSAKQGKTLQDNKLGKTENAVSATKLQTARTINNVLFDGTSNIDLIGSSGFAGTGLGAKSAELLAGNLRNYAYFSGWYTLAGEYTNAPTSNPITAQMLVSVRAYGAGTALVFQLWSNAGADYYVGSCTYIANSNNTVTPNSAISWRKVAYEDSNVASATRLQNARNINGVAFDGTENINLPLIGYGQTWQDVISSRAPNTTYTNNTGRPIQVMINYNFGQSGSLVLGGVNLPMIDGDAYSFFSFIVPNGTTYRLNGGGIVAWAELR